MTFDNLNDDIAYTRDLGIISQRDPLQIANPIYAEIIPRVMAYPIQATLPAEIDTQWFIDKQGNLDMDKLLKRFQEFYRRNSGAWLDRYEYKESAQHLLLMAFLQRVVNSGGDITREMAAGNGRLDLLVRYKAQEFALELKIRRDRYTVPEGKDQLCRYLDRLGLERGYLVIFDPRKLSWSKKLYFKTISHKGKTLTQVRL